MIYKFNPDIVVSDDTVILDTYGDFHFPHRDTEAEYSVITFNFLHVDVHGYIYHDSEYAHMISDDEFYIETTMFIMEA